MVRVKNDSRWQLHLCGGFALVFLLVSAAKSFAQTVDYAAMENLMGQPVTMSASGTPQTASDVSADMQIITADQIRQSGSRSIPQILSRVPGLDILQESATGYDVGVRGYQQSMQPSLLVLIDGRQVFSDDYSRTIWENLPVNIDDIRQIEVVKGPTSALFGSNAAHGVINIITYNPLYDNSNVANVSYGTQNNFSGDATATAKIPSASGGTIGGIKISAGGLGGDEFTTTRPASESAITKDPLHRYLATSGVFQVTPDLQAFSDISFSHSAGTEGYYNGQLAGVDDTTYSIRGGAVWQTPYGTIKSNNYLNYAQVQNGEVSGSLPYYSDITNAFTSQLEDQFRLGSDHTMRLSLEYNHKDFHLNAPQSLPMAGDTPEDSHIVENNFAVGGMWLWQITDQLAMTNALRADNMSLSENGPLVTGSPFTSDDFDHTITALSANSGLDYKVTPLDTVSVTYGRGIQMPSLLDYGFNDINSSSGSATAATERTGNPYLKPTIVTDYEVEYDRKLPDILSTGKFTLFYEVNQDIISPFPTVANPVVVGDFSSTRLREATNVGNSDGLGGEFQVLGSSPSGFRWDASYSYAQARDSSGVSNPPGTGPGVANSFGYDNSTPYHHFRFLLGYTTGPWEFDTNTQILTSRLLLRQNATRLGADGYVSLAGRIGYKITDDLTVALSAVNLNDNQMAQSPYPSIERQAFISLTAKF